MGCERALKVLKVTGKELLGYIWFVEDSKGRNEPFQIDLDSIELYNLSLRQFLYKKSKNTQIQKEIEENPFLIS